MSHDGTSHSDSPDVTARQIVELYHRNVSSTATTLDVWMVGDALLDYVGEVDGRVDSADSSITEIESEIEILMKLQSQMKETQGVVAKMIFELNEIGIDFQSKDINKYMIKYLKT